MLKYIVRRLLLMIPVILGVAFLVFALCRLAPGDPVKSLLGVNATAEKEAEVRAELGLDKGFFTQFYLYVKGIVTKLDFGTSYSDKRPVSDQLLSRFPISVKLGLMSMGLAVLFGIPFGIISAVKQYSALDYSVTVVSMFFASMPGFWLALMLMIIFALNLGWLPASGMSSWKSWILPAMASGLGPIASISRTTRSSMLEVIRQDYIRTARAKGVPERKIVTRHALKNALIPVVTVVGLQLGSAMGGSMIVENIFTLPGCGTLLLNAINTRNYPVIQGCVLLISVTISLASLIVDILYAFIDPRIKAQYSAKKKEKITTEAASDEAPAATA